MSNPMKYIKDLEAVGFQRSQAEAQVQMVLDAIEGDLVTKSDFAVFQERVDNRLTQFQERMENRFAQLQDQMEAKFAQFQANMESRFAQHQQLIQAQFKEFEFRVVTRLGFITVSTTSIAVAVLAWLIKV